MKQLQKRRDRHPVHWYLDRRQRVVEMRTLGNLTWEEIAKKITDFGYPPMTTDRAWKDYQAFLKDAERAIDVMERKAEVIAKLKGAFTLALAGYQKAEDAQGKAALMSRVIELLDRLGIVSGLNIAPKSGINISQVTGVTNNHTTLRDAVAKYRAERGLAALPD